MQLKDALDFVAPVLANKPTLPSLEHLYIAGGYLVAYDGLLAMCCPVEFPGAAKPHAKTLRKAVKAIGNATLVVAQQEKPSHITLSGGKVTVNVPVAPEDMPLPTPDFQGVPVLQGGKFLRVLKTLVPFTCEYDQRPWADTVLLKDEYAWACDIVSAVRMRLEVPMPAGNTLVVPRIAAEAIVATGVEPEVIYGSETRFVAQLPGNCFISAPTVTTPWPNLDFDAQFARAGGPVPEGFFEAAHKLSSFVKEDSDTVRFVTGAIRVEEDNAVLAEIKVDVPPIGTTSLQRIRQIASYAKTIDFSARPIVWHGEGIEGIINTHKTNA